MVTQIVVTSLSERGFPLVAPAGVFVMTAGTTLLDVGVSAVATATTATHPCLSTPPTPAHVRDKAQGHHSFCCDVVSSIQKRNMKDIS